MYVAEQIANVAKSGTGERQLASDTPLQIRMNPFMAAAKRAAFFDARIYLVERASSIGRPHLFTQEALSLAIDRSGGLQRDLRAIAQFAFFAAASEGAARIDTRHVVIAMESWAAQNGSPVPQKPRAAETALRIPAVTPQAPAALEKPAALAAPTDTVPLEAPAALENENAIVALPKYDVWPPFDALPETDAEPAAAETEFIFGSADGEVASGVTSPSLIRRQVLSFIEAEARCAPEKILVAKRRWLLRAAEITAAFLALFAFFGMISAHIANRNASPPKPAFAVQVQQADLKEAVVEPPAPTPAKPVQGYVIPEPVKEVVAATPPEPTPPSEPVAEETPVADPAPEAVQDQVPAEDYIKSETP